MANRTEAARARSEHRHARRTLAPELPADPSGRLIRLVPFTLVGLAVAFNLWVLRAESLPVLQLNDSSVHESMVRWALSRTQAGHLTLDGWYPYLSLGSSLFHHYQSLPHTLTAYLALAVGPDRAFSWTLYLLLATWPISVYLGARLMGWERWPAAAAALVSPLIVSAPGYGFEHGSYTWRGLGIWSELWAMWLLPLAWGFSWRAVDEGRSYAPAALLVGLTAACHFLTGFLAFLAVGVWVLVRPSRFLQRLARAAVVAVGGALIIAWVIVPVLLDARWTNQSEFLRGTFWFDSYGAAKVLRWLFAGGLFDAQRLPVVSLLVAAGAVVCGFHFTRDARARALLGVFALSFVLFSGRESFGWLIRFIPGNQDLLLHRFVAGMHLAGILLAGVGAAWLGGLLVGLRGRFAPRMRAVAAGGLALVIGIAFLWPAWRNVASLDAESGGWIHDQRAFDATDGADIRALAAEAQSIEPGRIYAGSSANWGAQYRVWSVPVYAALLGSDADAVGFYLRTTSLSSDVEARFDETNPAQVDAFGIRWLILPSGHQPPVPATLVDTRGLNTLWRVDTTGYLAVVDTIGPPVVADRTNLGAATQGFMASDQLASKLFPTVAFGGDPAALPTHLEASVPTGVAGTVDFTFASLSDGEVAAQVTAQRPAVVVLKASYDPRWTATVDGTQVPTQMVAPSFVGVQVPTGMHHVVFRYQTISFYWLLLLIGLLALVGLVLIPRRLERRRSGIAADRSEDRPAAAEEAAEP